MSSGPSSMSWPDSCAANLASTAFFFDTNAAPLVAFAIRMRAIRAFCNFRKVDVRDVVQSFNDFVSSRSSHDLSGCRPLNLRDRSKFRVLPKSQRVAANGYRFDAIPLPLSGPTSPEKAAEFFIKLELTGFWPSFRCELILFMGFEFEKRV